MSRTLQVRLGRLEKLESAHVESADSFVIIYRLAEADGALAEPAQCRSVDGRLNWDREASESAEDFEERVTDEASRPPNSPMLIMLPDNARNE